MARRLLTPRKGIRGARSHGSVKLDTPTIASLLGYMDVDWRHHSLLCHDINCAPKSTHVEYVLMMAWSVSDSKTIWRPCHSAADSLHPFYFFTYEDLPYASVARKGKLRVTRRGSTCSQIDSRERRAPGEDCNQSADQKKFDTRSHVVSSFSERRALNQHSYQG